MQLFSDLLDLTFIMGAASALVSLSSLTPSTATMKMRYYPDFPSCVESSFLIIRKIIAWLNKTYYELLRTHLGLFYLSLAAGFCFSGTWRYDVAWPLLGFAAAIKEMIIHSQTWSVMFLPLLPPTHRGNTWLKNLGEKNGNSLLTMTQWHAAGVSIQRDRGKMEQQES